MDAIDRFISEQNIERFAKQAYDALDPGKQQTLRELLIEEEYRFGVYSAQLEITTRHISEAEAKISRQKALIARLEADGHELNKAYRILYNFVDIQHLFKDFRASILQALNRNKI